MALAETAELAVRLKLDDSQFSRAVAGVDRKLGNLSTGVGRFARSAAKIGAVAAGAVAGFGVVAIKDGIDNLAKLENATTQVSGAIATMGKTGQVTANQIAGWAVQIETAVQSAFDDKDITAATATLIRYGNIATSEIQPAMVVMTDLAARTGDVASASKLLAKALADPTKAAGALRKAGIVLSDAQDKQIKGLVKQGKLEQAQAILLQILTTRTKGAAAAINGPYVDAQKELKDAWEESTKALAVGFLPVITRLNTWLKDKLADPKVQQAIKDIGQNLADAADKALTFVQSIPWDKVGDGLRVAADFAGKLIGIFTSMPPQVQGTILALAGLNKLSGGAVSGAVKGVVGDLAGLVGKALGGGLKKIFAAEVTVVGANVTGGGGLPGVGGNAAEDEGLLTRVATATIAGISLGTIALIAGAAVASTAAFVNTYHGPDAMQFSPIDLSAAFAPPKLSASDLKPLGEALAKAYGYTGPTMPRPKGEHALDGGQVRRIATEEQKVGYRVRDLKDRLASVLKQEGAANRAGDTRHANVLAAKEAQIRGQLSAANAKLTAIRNKKTKFTVNTHVSVNTSVAVSELKRQARYSSKVARTTALSAS